MEVFTEEVVEVEVILVEVIAGSLGGGSYLDRNCESDPGGSFLTYWIKPLVKALNK